MQLLEMVPNFEHGYKEIVTKGNIKENITTPR